MTRSPWLRAVAFFLLCAVGHAFQDNVLLVIADDYGVDSSSLYNTTASGASLPPTPRLANLAASGVRFENAYAYAVCSPTRAAILTGRHAFRTGIHYVVSDVAGNSLTASEFTLPDAFATLPAPGYALASFGKWHLTAGPGNRFMPCTVGGWPYFSGFLNGAVTSYTNWTKVITDGTPLGTYVRAVTGYQTSVTVDDTLSWIGVQQAANRPWFAWVAFAAPHTPLHKPPAALCGSYANLTGTAADIAANPRAYYEASVEALDRELARLFAGIDLAHTNVIFVGDNGTPPEQLQPPFPAGRGKDTLYEGGVRVPLIISGPAVANQGSVCAEPVHVVDLFSTILDLAGIDPRQVVPPGTIVDSHSLAPILYGIASARTSVFEELDSALAPGNIDRSIRDARYKLIEYAATASEFYDLQNDPYEAVDLLAGTLTADEQARLARLQLELASCAPDTGAAFCSADGVLGEQTTLCPCSNAGAVGHGCAHSANFAGGSLSASGSASADDVRLCAASLPGTAFTLFLQHDASGDQVFHDGVLCASGTLVRLRGRGAFAGSASFPDPALDSTLTLSQRGGVVVGSGVQRYYSAWFRNASVSFCPPATANVTNGWRLSW